MPKRALVIAGVAVVVLGVLLRAAFFNISVRHIPPSSDESIPALQAIGITQASDNPLFQAKQYPRCALGRFPMLMMAQPYLFIFDAYVNAIPIRFLPHNAIGARFGAVLLGWLSVLLALMTLRRWSGWRESWPAAVLVLFPSSYLLTLQTAYALPSYAPFLFFSALVVLLAQIHRNASRRVALWAFAAGLAAGLASSSSLLALPLLAGAGAMICLSTNWRRALCSTPTFAAGALIGFAPYELAKRMYPGAFDAVSNTIHWQDALARLWEPTVTFTLQVALGFRPCYWPDNEGTFSVIPGTEGFFPFLWAVLFVAATVLCLVRFLVRTIRNRWPSVEIEDVLVGVSWICLAFFILNRRSNTTAYRYLLFLAWSFPFIVGYLYWRSGKVLKIALAAITVFLAVWNFAATATVMKSWSSPEFAAKEASLYDLKPVIKYLDERGIDRCYASWHIAYRLTYITDERIVCGQYFNERFVGWPVPYRNLVDASTNVAYVLLPRFGIKPEDFEGDLAVVGVKARRQECGDFTVYTDFEGPALPPEQKLDSAALKVETSVYPEDAAKLLDGNYVSRWWSHEAQKPGMSITISLPAAVPVSRISMYYNFYRADRAAALDVLARRGSRWIPVAKNVRQGLDPFEVVNGHPTMGNQLQTIRFKPTVTDQLRIEISEPEVGRDWTVMEVEVFSRP
jgi:hypothetical protein